MGGKFTKNLTHYQLSDIFITIEQMITFKNLGRISPIFRGGEVDIPVGGAEVDRQLGKVAPDSLHQPRDVIFRTVAR